MAVIIEAPQLDPVAPGKRAVMILPLGPTYHGLIFKLSHGGGGAFTKAHITMLRLKLNNGKELFEISGTALDEINTYAGMAQVAGYLRLNFTEHLAKTIQSELAGIIDTSAGMTKMVLEMDIDAAAVSPIIEAWVHVSTGLAAQQQNPQNLANVACVERSAVSWGAAKEWQIELPHGAGAGRLIKRIFLMSNLVTKVRIKKNGVEVYNMVKDVNDFLEADYQSAPQAGMTVIDFIMTNNTIEELLTTEDAQSLTMFVTLSGADAFDIYTQSLVDYNKL
jgi:hypothetical protein